MPLKNYEKFYCYTCQKYASRCTCEENEKNWEEVM